MAKADDNLFLLEVLVDRIVFEKAPCFAEQGFRTLVSITCMEMDPLLLSDDDDTKGTSTRSSGPFIKNMNTGKSCLFSMPSADVSKAKNKFTITANVYKEMACGCIPTKVKLGSTAVDMTKEFVEAYKKYEEDPNSVAFQSLKDNFRLYGEDGGMCGEIIMFLRISCFGKSIVTRFQGSSDPPTLGGQRGPGVVDRSCNPTRDFQKRDDPCVCGASHGGNLVGRKAGVGAGPCPMAQDPHMPCQDPDEPCYCSGPKAMAKQPMSCRNTEQYCLHVPKGSNKEFEEIGMNVTGNELKIKVPASASIIKKISQTHCALQTPFVKRGKGTDKNKQDGPCIVPCGKNQISLILPSEATCCRGPPLADTEFHYTTEGCLQASKHAQQLALARADLKGEKDQDLARNVNVFVLKVAKTALQGDRKCKLEMELVAPKGPDKNMPVQKISRRMQSDCCECNRCCSRRPKKK